MFRLRLCPIPVSPSARPQENVPIDHIDGLTPGGTYTLGPPNSTSLVVASKRSTKKRKSFAAILATDKEAALRELRKAANFIIVTQKVTPTSAYCVPNMM